MASLPPPYFRWGVFGFPTSDPHFTWRCYFLGVLIYFLGRGFWGARVVPPGLWYLSGALSLETLSLAFPVPGWCFVLIPLS